ncbi:MAG: hypothetical protein ABI321_09260 [Polyangia bacterium]
MRVALLALVIGLGGCLFVGGINREPTASIHATDLTVTGVGVPVHLVVEVSDDQPDARAVVTVFDDQCEPHHGCRDASRQPLPGSPSCVEATLTPTGGGYSVVFYRAGVYVVQASPVDRYGAIGSPASLTITIVDEPPVLGDGLHAGSAATACGASYTASRPVPIVLAEDAVDPEATTVGAASCSAVAPTLAHHWSITSQPTGAGRLGRATTTGACPAVAVDPAIELDTDITVVCLYPDPTVSSVTSSTYGIELAIDDGVLANTIVTDTMVSVLGDSPACLGGVYPGPGSYVVSGEDPTVFQVVGADDVTSAGDLDFTWSLERNGVWEVVLDATRGIDGGARLSLDPTTYGFAVGEHVTLRVDVTEPDATPSCDVADDSCLVASCVAAPQTTCASRATWSLEVR